jgi:hypothetical protein
MQVKKTAMMTGTTTNGEVMCMVSAPFMESSKSASGMRDLRAQIGGQKWLILAL